MSDGTVRGDTDALGGASPTAEEPDEIVQEFLVESYENLDQLDRDLVALERDPADRELLAGVFRTIHTIKGTSGFLAFGRLEALTHVGENLLSRLRDGALTLTPARTSLQMVDEVRGLLAGVEATRARAARGAVRPVTAHPHPLAPHSTSQGRP